MRHRRNTTKLGRTSSHRNALLANQVCSLIEHGRIKTTLAKAKAVRPLAEQMVTLLEGAGLLVLEWTRPYPCRYPDEDKSRIYISVRKEPENEKLFNKKRNDILYLLNKGKSSKPETISKYKILLDEKTKKYYYRDIFIDLPQKSLQNFYK